MIKILELSDPKSCMSRARDYEMTFVLLARDRVGALTVRIWCLLRVLFRKNRWADPQIREALHCARRMDEQRAQIKRKREAAHAGQEGAGPLGS